jgi:hypothetical protein
MKKVCVNVSVNGEDVVKEKDVLPLLGATRLLIRTPHLHCVRGCKAPVPRSSLVNALVKDNFR